MAPPGVALSDLFWTDLLTRPMPIHPLVRELPGLLALITYFVVTPWLMRVTILRHRLELGALRYSVLAVLLLGMVLVPIKMTLRSLGNVQYIVNIHEWFMNV